MLTITRDLVLPCTVTGSWPRPRWFDVEHVGQAARHLHDGRPLPREVPGRAHHRHQRRGARRARHPHPRRPALRRGPRRAAPGTTTRCSAGPASTATCLQSEETRSPVAALSAGHAAQRDLHRLALAARGGQDRAPPARLRQDLAPGAGKHRKPVRFGTCCSQVMGLFLDIHTPKYKDKREVVWDMAVGHEHRSCSPCATPAAAASRSRSRPCTSWANTYGAKHDEVKFMIECYNREVQGLDDVEIWIHTCWGNPNMQRVIDDTSYAASFELYLQRAAAATSGRSRRRTATSRTSSCSRRCKGKLPKKICIGAVSHRTLQVDRPEDVAARIRRGARAHRPRAADRLERLRLRAPGLQPRHRLLQGHRHRAGHATSSAASWGCRSHRCSGRGSRAADGHRPEDGANLEGGAGKGCWRQPAAAIASAWGPRRWSSMRVRSRFSSQTRLTGLCRNASTPRRAAASARSGSP